MIRLFRRPRVPFRGMRGGPSIKQVARIPTHAPYAAALNGTSSWINLDGLAADAYGQTKIATGYVMLVKSVTPGSRYWAALANADDLGTYQTPLAALSGKLSATIVLAGTTKQNAQGPAQTQHVDGEWHLIHGADHYGDPSGLAYRQVDGATRSFLGAYVRFASPTPDYSMFSLGVLRYKSGPTFFGYSAGTLGYFARYDDEILDQASWDAIFAAFDTGGGRSNTRRITEAIQNELTTGTLKYAIALDGSAPHVDPDSVGAPTFVDVEFEPANYVAPKYAYMTSGAYMRASDADAATINANIKSAATPFTMIAVMGSDPELGDVNTFRVFFGASTNVGSAGSYYQVRNIFGKYRLDVVRDDGTNIRNADTLPIVTDGHVNQWLHVETAVASVAQTTVSINGVAFVNLGATWLRTELGQLDWFAYAGQIRGPVPTINPELGHCYFRAVIDEDLTADRTAIWDAFNDVLQDDLSNMPAAIAAMLAAIEAAVTVPADNIIYAETYTPDSVAHYGDTAIKVGVTFTPAGVTP